MKLNTEDLKRLLSIISDISSKEELEKNVNSCLDSYFYSSFLESNGINVGNYRQILELNQGVLGSVSLFLENYKQFLLSEDLNYGQLHAFDLNGGKGNLTEEGIFIPKSLESDEHFLYGGYMPKVPYTRHSYEYPKLTDSYSEYDMVISKGLSSYDNLNLIFKLGLDFVLGDTLDRNSPKYKEKRKLLIRLLELYNERTSNQGKMIFDTLGDKEYILLKRVK